MFREVTKGSILPYLFEKMADACCIRPEYRPRNLIPGGDLIREFSTGAHFRRRTIAEKPRPEPHF
jgi:hypothetical protein